MDDLIAFLAARVGARQALIMQAVDGERPARR